MELFNCITTNYTNENLPDILNKANKRFPIIGRTSRIPIMMFGEKIQLKQVEYVSVDNGLRMSLLDKSPFGFQYKINGVDYQSTLIDCLMVVPIHYQPLSPSMNTDNYTKSPFGWSILASGATQIQKSDQRLIRIGVELIVDKAKIKLGLI